MHPAPSAGNVMHPAPSAGKVMHPARWLIYLIDLVVELFVSVVKSQDSHSALRGILELII